MRYYANTGLTSILDLLCDSYFAQQLKTVPYRIESPLGKLILKLYSKLALEQSSDEDGRN